ncbi:unnamed protein product [Aphis gossypii]|uniref:Uncharacterized protein n=1 Tax=Aphis gossypii TaxID=80765 RepID=A0A9P0J315_APHGO|nr:unnamed protein product [Aphis gossypii]
MQFGRQITLSETTRHEYSKVEFLCSPFEFLENAIFVSWVDFKGTTYNSNNMSVLINFSDNPNILPIFGLILSIFIQTNNIPFFICKIYENKYFDEHFQAYNVQLTEKLICCSVEQLDCVHPTVHCVLSNGLSYIYLHKHM